MKSKKLTGLLTAMTLSFGIMNIPSVKTYAASNEFNFDFGAGGVEKGFIGVKANEGYRQSKGYGFNRAGNMANVSASGKGELSDAVQFKSTSTNNTFNVDLDNGLYEITVTLGNTNRASVWAEGCLQVINMTGNNATHTFQLPITDGQLNLMVTEGRKNTAFTLSSLKIKKISNNAQMKPTVWLCGDSTVCNYYPLNSSTQAGWGQMLENYIDKNKWQVRNMASSGQYAKGFLDAGQFEAIRKYGKKGDIFFISIGINDTNYSNSQEYYTNVKKMAQEAKNKGMQVVLVKQQGRSNDISRKPLLNGRWFGGELDKIGQELNLQVVDLFNLSQNYFLSIGQTATTNLYMKNDQLHPNREGAKVLAKLVADQVDFSGNGGNNVNNPGNTAINKPSQNSSTVKGENIAEGKYRIKNLASGLYLDVTGGISANKTNVQQWAAGDPAPYNTWTIKSAGNGYYKIYSNVGNRQFLLDLDYGKRENGTNIQIYQDTNSDAQQFKFAKANNGSYIIYTKSSKDKSCLDVNKKSKENGANIQQWEYNGGTNQMWILEKV